MSDREQSVKVSSGVDTLIQRLRDEGVADGRQRAEKIVAEAEARATWIIEQANNEAEQILGEAKAQTERLQQSATEALRIAARDAVLDLKTRLLEGFTDRIRRLVRHEMQQTELLQRMILEVAGQAREDVDPSGEIEIVLPRDVVGLEELTQNPAALAQGALTDFVRMASRDGLQEGVTFRTSADEHGGIRMVLKDQGLSLELTDEAVAELLLQHLQPRFRALVEGVVK